MDRRERTGDAEEAIRTALEGSQGKLWTALPGIIDSFNASAMTCTVKPSISGSKLLPDGTRAPFPLPLLLDCPVCFTGGGGVTLTFPIQSGDECLIVFASRCIDSWWAMGGIQGQAEFRMHDLSDGFVLPGVRSQPRKFTVSTSSAQLRTDDGSAYVEIDPASHKITALTSGDIESTASGQITMTAPVVTINAPIIVLNGQVTQGAGSNGGTMSVTGPMNVTNDVVAGGKSLIHHVHSGVQTGGGTTGQPV